MSNPESSDETLADLLRISKINYEIDSLRAKIYRLEDELKSKKNKIKSYSKINPLLYDIKVPFLLRDVYVFTYFYKGCYAWQHAIFYGLPRKSEYSETIEKLCKEDDAGTMRIASSNFNKVQGFDSCYRMGRPADYIWSEGLRDDSAEPLAPIDKGVIYVLTDDKEKGEYDTVLGVYTNPVELAKKLEMWDSDTLRSCYVKVSIYVVQGNECCILYPYKNLSKDEISFMREDYKGNIAHVLLALTEKALSKS